MSKQIQTSKDSVGVVLTLGQICALTGFTRSEAARQLAAMQADHVWQGSRKVYPLAEAWRVFGGTTNEHAARDRLRRTLAERLLWVDVDLEALRSPHSDESEAFATTRRALTAAWKSMTPAAWSGLYRRAYGQAPKTGRTRLHAAKA